MQDNPKAAVAAIIFLIVGVGVSVMSLIFIGALGGSTYHIVEPQLDEIGYGNAVANENFTALNSTANTLAHTHIDVGSLTIQNSTGTPTFGLGNFTVDYAAGTVLLLNGTYNNTAMNASYTWSNVTIRNSVKTSIVSGFSALETTGDYIPIMVLAVVIAIVLTLVLSFVAFRGGGMGKGAVL